MATDTGGGMKVLLEELRPHTVCDRAEDARRGAEVDRVAGQCAGRVAERHPRGHRARSRGPPVDEVAGEQGDRTGFGGYTGGILTAVAGVDGVAVERRLARRFPSNSMSTS